MSREFGAVLKDIRTKNGWTLEEMAEKLETTKQAISKYERGERTPKITVAAKFATILGVPLEMLTGQEYEEKEKEVIPKTYEARIISGGIDKMPKERREQALKILQIAFAEFADLFEEEENNDDT